MPFYRLAGQDFYFQYPAPETESFETNDKTYRTIFPRVLNSLSEIEPAWLISQTEGWVGDRRRSLEIYNVPSGILLNVADCGQYLVSESEESISQFSQIEWSPCDRQVIFGPALVIALALREVWSLHASAALYNDKVTVFLGESGQGKSTLAAYLAGNMGWRLIADDILPARVDLNSVNVLPHFPQLKLPTETQPGPKLPECLPLTTLCVLTSARQDTMPELQLLPPGLAMQALLRHTAGTRMFTPEMLGRHLSFCSLFAGQIPVYQLSYPHRKDGLPGIRDLLENLC